MTTFNPNIENIFNERFAQSEDTSDFLGLCFGSGRCKRRRDARRKAREGKRDARNQIKIAKAEGIRNGTFKSTGSGLLNTLGSLASNIFGGGGGSEQAPVPEPQMYTNQPTAPAPAKKNKKIIYVVIALVIVAGFAFYAMKKSKK